MSGCFQNKKMSADIAETSSKDAEATSFSESDVVIVPPATGHLNLDGDSGSGSVGSWSDGVAGNTPGSNSGAKERSFFNFKKRNEKKSEEESRQEENNVASLNAKLDRLVALAEESNKHLEERNKLAQGACSVAKDDSRTLRHLRGNSVLVMDMMAQHMVSTERPDEVCVPWPCGQKTIYRIRDGVFEKLESEKPAKED